MQTRSRLALSLLAGTLALPSVFAQNPPAGSGPSGPGPGDGPSSPHRMGPGQQRGPEGWKRGDGERGGGRFHGMRGHHGMRGGHRGRGEFAFARLADDPAAREKLGITEEQASKIRQETSEFRKTEIRGRADLQVRRLELEDLLRADSPDRAAIDKKLDEIGAARLAQTKAEVHYRLAMREMLTPEQRQKLKQMRMEFRHRGFEGRPPRGPMGRRPPQANP